MQIHNVNSIFSDAYGQSSFGGCVYNQSSICSSNSGTTTNGSVPTGTLADTGLLLLVIAASACVLITLGLIIRFWRRPDKHVQATKHIPRTKSDIS